MSVKSVLMAFVAAGALAVHAEPKIDKLTVRQNWPWSPEVKIEYALTDVNPAEPVDVNVSLFADGASLPYTGSEIAGRRFGVTENGVYTLTVDAQRLLAGRKSIVSLKADVSVSASSVQSQEVLYKIFDLSAATVTNVTRGALLNGDWGSVETDFGRIGPGYNTTLSDVVIWTGVTNDIAYKTTKLVLRKIPAGDFKGFQLGTAAPAANNMTWTNDYWMGVFELTQKQIRLVGYGSDNGGMQNLWVTKGDAFPAHAVHNYIMYNHMKSRTAFTGTGGFFQRLRQKFTVDDVCPYDFELPTIIQWNRAFHAGTESYYYDGLPTPENVEQNDQFAALGLYRYNGGLEGGVSNVVEVGSFRPNAYGLYDMLGNVDEFLRDSGWNFAYWSGGTNVTGAIGAETFVWYYGGCFDKKGNGFGVGGINGYSEQIHSDSSNRIHAGLRVCMQDRAYGLQMVGQ